jgi:hypothetical protein
MPAEPPTVSQENRPPAIGGALACEASFGSNNRHEGIVLNCAAMANRMSRFWMAARGTTLSRGAFSYDAVGQNRNPSLGGAPAPAVQVKREIWEGLSQLAIWTRRFGRSRELSDKNVVSNCVAHEFSIVRRSKHLHDAVLVKCNGFG